MEAEHTADHGHSSRFRSLACRGGELSDLRFIAAFLLATKCIRNGLRNASDLLERRFAEFADVPYENRVSRQQWQQLWDAEREQKAAPSLDLQNARRLLGERGRLADRCLAKGPMESMLRPNMIDSHPPIG
jgi:hypothetical protein